MQAQLKAFVRLLLAVLIVLLFASEYSADTSGAGSADSAGNGASSIFQMDRHMLTNHSPLSVAMHNQW